MCFTFQDVVILNKVDLIPQEALEDLEKAICDINSLAIVIPSVRCQVDLNRILDRQAYGAKASITHSIFFSLLSSYILNRHLTFITCSF